MLILHGWGADSTLVFPIAKRINAYSIIPDMYGFGKTPHGDTPLTVEDYAKGVLDILEKEGISSVSVIGHSFGGRVGIYLASHYPKIVERLVLVDSAGLKPRRGLRYYFRVFFYKIKKKLGLDTSKSGSKEYQSLKGAMRKTYVNVVNFDQAGQLACIFSPTLIIWGGRDRVTPIYMAKKLCKKIKRSELFVIEKAGHFSYADNLDLFSVRIKAFLGV